MSERREFDEKPTISPSVDRERPPRLSFGPFVVDPETGRLSEGERIIPLAPKPFETLHYLAGRSGRVVSKSELMERLWTDTFVTDDVLVQCVMDIRRALRGRAEAPKEVRTRSQMLARIQVALRV